MTKEKRAVYMKQYRIDNKEKLTAYNKRYSKIWHLQNPSYNKNWRLKNPDYHAEYNANHKKEHAEYYGTHKAKIRQEQAIYGKQYYQNNKGKEAERKRLYFTTLAGKMTRLKTKAKRRHLGFIPLNEPFEGCESHHISFNFVIYIPKELHKSLYHNIWTWKNMEQMNKLAIEWL